MHTLDALMPEPAPGAATVPLFFVAKIPRDAIPGWYAASVRVSANEQTWDLPVQILVSPVVLPDARDFSSLMGLYSSPETVAIYGKVTPYSDEHLKLMEPSFAMQAQVGNDILHVPVILGGFGASPKSWVGRGFDGADPEKRLMKISSNAPGNRYRAMAASVKEVTFRVSASVRTVWTPLACFSQ